MTVGEWLNETDKRLEAVGINSARLDTLILLEDELAEDRSYLLAHPEIELAQAQLNKLNKQIIRRTNHEPIAYIRGFSEFYGRRFTVNKDVLEPRPESETMIELLKELDLPEKPVIADVGAGCGAIGITASLEIPSSQVDLFEIDPKALVVAKQNCQKYKVRLDLYGGDLLQKHQRSYQVILANLPYVPNSWQINQAAMMEPRLAIFGGQDGLDLYRKLFTQLANFAWQPSFVLTEALPPQHKQLVQVADRHGFKLHKSKDFIQVFKPKR